MRIAFAGTPEFAAHHLSALLQACQSPSAANLQLVGVLTQPDRAAGRGLVLTPSPVKLVAQAAGLPVLTPLSLRADRPDGPEAQAWLAQQDLDWLVVVAYGLLLPKAVLEIPRHGCLNVHASDLPRWRGAAPIQRAIEAGDQQTAVCLMQMEEGLDTGPVWRRAAVPIEATDNSQTLQSRLAAVGAAELVQFLSCPPGPSDHPTPQATDQVTYAKKILADDRLLVFSKPARQLVNQIRALEPAPAAQLLAHETIASAPVKCGGAVLLQAHGRWGAPGQVVQLPAAHQPCLGLACGEGVLGLSWFQRPGGKRVTAAEFVRGMSLEEGDDRLAGAGGTTGASQGS